MADPTRDVRFNNDPVVLTNYTPLEDEGRHPPSKLSSGKVRDRAKSESALTANPNKEGNSRKHRVSLGLETPSFPSEVSILDNASKQPLIVKMDLQRVDSPTVTTRDKSPLPSVRSGSEEKDTDGEDMILSPAKQPSIKKLQKQNKELTKKNQQLLKAMEALRKERESEKERLKAEKKGRKLRSSSREKSLDSEELTLREPSHDYHGIELQRRIVELEILLAKREGELAALQHRLSTNSHLLPSAENLPPGSRDLTQGIKRESNKTLLQKFIDEQDANIRLVSENHDLKLKFTSLETELEKVHLHQQHLQEHVQVVPETKPHKKRHPTFGFRWSGRKSSAAAPGSGGQGLSEPSPKHQPQVSRLSAPRHSLEGSLSDQDIQNLLGRKSAANGTQSGSCSPKVDLSQTVATVDSQILQTSLKLTQDEKVSLEKQLESLKEELKAQHEKLEELSKDAAKTESMVGTKTEMERLKSALMTSLQEKETLWNENENMKNDLEDLRAERDTLAASIRGMEIKANLKQKQEMEFLTSENEALTKEIKTSMANLDGMQTILGRLKRELATKEVKENELRVKTRKLEQENDKLAKEVKELTLSKERKAVEEKETAPRRTSSSKRKNSDSQKPPSSPHKTSASRKRSNTVHSSASPLSPTKTLVEVGSSSSETVQAPSREGIPFPRSSAVTLEVETANDFLPKPSHERTKSSPVFFEEALVPSNDELELSYSGKEKRAVATSTTLPSREKALKVTGRASSTPSLDKLGSKDAPEVTTSSCPQTSAADKRKQFAESLPGTFQSSAGSKHSSSSSAVNSLVKMFDKYGTTGPRADASQMAKDSETPEVIVMGVEEDGIAVVSSVQFPKQRSGSLGRSREVANTTENATDLQQEKSKTLPLVSSVSRSGEWRETAEIQRSTTDSSPKKKEEKDSPSLSPSRKASKREGEASVNPQELQKVPVVQKSSQKAEQLSPSHNKEPNSTSSVEPDKASVSHKRTPSNTSGTFVTDVNSPVKKLASFFASKGDSSPSTFPRDRSNSKTDLHGLISKRRNSATALTQRETKTETTSRELTTSSEGSQDPRSGSGANIDSHSVKTQQAFVPPTANKEKEKTQKEEPSVGTPPLARVSPTQTPLTIAKPKPPPSFSSQQQPTSSSSSRDSSGTLHSSLERKKPNTVFPLTTSTIAPTTTLTTSKHKPLVKTFSVPVSASPRPAVESSSSSVPRDPISSAPKPVSKTQNGSMFVVGAGTAQQSLVTQTAPVQAQKPYLSKMASTSVINPPLPTIQVHTTATTTASPKGQNQPQEKSIPPAKGIAPQKLMRFDTSKRCLSDQDMLHDKAHFPAAKPEASDTSLTYRHTVPVVRSSKRPASMYVTNNNTDKSLSSLIAKLQEKEGRSVSPPTPVNNRNSTAVSGHESERTKKRAELTRPHTMYFDEGALTPELKRISSFSSPLGLRSSKKQRLLRWCQLHTIDYDNINIVNFGESFSNGLAFCALMHHFIPDQIPYYTLSPHSQRKNFEIAFGVGESLGIPSLLDVDDMVALEIPDWMSVMTYVSYIYKHFSGFGEEKAL